jgi:hypothetical protein
VEALRRELGDPALYEDGDGIQRSVALKAEMADMERTLSAALDAWAEAGEALQESE